MTLVDEYGKPIRAGDLEVGSFATAFPQGVDTDLLGSPLIVVRIAPSLVDLPAGRRRWAVDGIIAYSKICTHAGCAVAMMRYPLYAAHTAQPALVCPCHYSTFDVRDRRDGRVRPRRAAAAPAADRDRGRRDARRAAGRCPATSARPGSG